MTAQELYKVWIKEHADDLRGDWPIRFADYCMSVNCKEVMPNAGILSRYSPNDSSGAVASEKNTPSEEAIILLHHKWVTQDDLSHEEVQQKLKEVLHRTMGRVNNCLSAANARIAELEQECALRQSMFNAKDVVASGLADRIAELTQALRGLLNLTDQGREGGMILSRYDHKPITNGDQDIIDQAYVAAERALSSPAAATAKENSHGTKARD